MTESKAFLQRDDHMSNLRNKSLRIASAIIGLTGILIFASYGLSRSVAATTAGRSTGADLRPKILAGSILFRGDTQRTGAYDDTGIRQMSRLKWSRPFGSVVNESPVFADGVLYLGSGDGRIHAIDSITGNNLWSFKAKTSRVFSPVAVADGIVYVGSEKKLLYALNAGTGRKLWQFKTKSVVWTAPLVVNGTVYFASQEGNFFAVDISTRRQKWKLNTRAVQIHPPAFDNGTVYFSAQQTLYALDGETGQERWKIEKSANEAWSAPAIANGILYAGNQDGHVYAIDTQTGAVLWDSLSDSDAWSSPSIADGRVYIGNKSGSFYGLDAQTGAIVWRFQTEDSAMSAPIVAGGVVYFGVGNHEFPPREGPRHLYALDGQTGEELWKFQAGSRLLSGVAIGNGAIYVASFAGRLYAVE